MNIDGNLNYNEDPDLQRALWASLLPNQGHQDPDLEAAIAASLDPDGIAPPRPQQAPERLLNNSQQTEAALYEQAVQNSLVDVHPNYAADNENSEAMQKLLADSFLASHKVKEAVKEKLPVPTPPTSHKVNEVVQEKPPVPTPSTSHKVNEVVQEKPPVPAQPKVEVAPEPTPKKAEPEEKKAEPEEEKEPSPQARELIRKRRLEYFSRLSPESAAANSAPVEPVLKKTKPDSEKQDSNKK